MPKMGDIPVPVVFTRDQIRILRGMTDANLSTPIGEINDRVAILMLLDDAETSATIRHAQRETAHIEWSKRVESAPHWRCGTVHGSDGCPRGGGNDGWSVTDGEWAG
jgi:hypothetical protein